MNFEYKPFFSVYYLATVRPPLPPGGQHCIQVPPSSYYLLVHFAAHMWPINEIHIANHNK